MSAQGVAMLELVRSATVRLARADGSHLGTGFFAAPGMVLTAAHVVAAERDDPAGVVVIWNGTELACTTIGLVAEPEPGWPDNHAPYPWPDAAILKVPHRGHPCVRLSKTWPVDFPPPRLYGWAFARDYDPSYVAGTSVRLDYIGPAAAPSPVPAPGWPAPNMLNLKWDKIIGGMSGAPLLDETTLEVCAIMKRTRSELESAGGFATAVADVLGQAHAEGVADDVAALVRELGAAHDAYVQALDEHAPVEATARWGDLPDQAAELIAKHGLADALTRELAKREYDVAGGRSPAADRPQCVARALFATDVGTLSSVLVEVVAAKLVEEDVALAIFELVACCLPVSKDWRTELADRPVAWWIPPNAADQLSEELRAERPRIAHVASDSLPTVRMLVRRASRARSLRLLDLEVLPDLPPDGSFLERVTSLIRQEMRAEDDWLEIEGEREYLREYFADDGRLIPLPSTALASDLAQLRSEFGDLPFVLKVRQLPASLDGCEHLVHIRPEIDVLQETAALRRRRVLEPRRAS